MKNTLSINTVGNGTQISLQKGNEVFYCDMPFAKHSETLFNAIETVLDKHNVTLSNINCLGVVTGPGSFTGIRIGLSVVKTFAYVHNLPIIAVNSLEVLAYSIFNKPLKVQSVCAVMNAGANQVYYQVFNVKDDELVYNTMPRVDTIEHFKEYINTLSDVLILGPDEIPQLKNLKKVNFDAKSLQKAIRTHQLRRDFCDNSQVQPLYLRLAQVEVCKINLEELDMPLARESEIMALCGLDNQQDEFYAAWNVYDWQTKLLQPTFVCKEVIHKGSLIGAIAYTIKKDVVEIARLVVDKRARNQGVAKRLLQIVLNEFKVQSIKEVSVLININNLPAINLFSSIGFDIKNSKNKTDKVALLTKKLV